MGKIYIIGLGPGNEDALTLGAINRINSGHKNFLRTEKHPTVEYFKTIMLSIKVLIMYMIQKRILQMYMRKLFRN